MRPAGTLGRCLLRLALWVGMPFAHGADASPMSASPAVGADVRPVGVPRVRFYQGRAADGLGGEGAPPPTVRPGVVPPYQLNFSNIVRIVYDRNPTVRASREEMVAGRHALDEFRANLGRLEPYVGARSDLSDFPNRRGAFGNVLESVVGVKKESFNGSVLSTEVGASHSRFEFARAPAGLDAVEAGAGALMRSRVEVPFLGSRRRQERVIAQAFQEATARKAQLDYLRNFRAQVENALSYYNQVVFWQRSLDSSERWMAALDALLRDPRLRDADRPRIEAARAAVESSWNHVASRQQENLGAFLAYLGSRPDAEAEVELPPYRLSVFVQQARDTNGVRGLVERARANNPAFRILRNAIDNARLQRDQAVRGRYDVTTFLEGSLFPLGSQTFDDRYQGWAVAAGVNVRLNDRRVRDASRRRAEAQIRQFEAEMAAEELGIQQRIASTVRTILNNDENRDRLLAASARLKAVFEARRAEYFAGTLNIDQLLGTRGDIASNEGEVYSNVQLTAEREAVLALATGQVYEMVGLRMDDDDLLAAAARDASATSQDRLPVPPSP